MESTQPLTVSTSTASLPARDSPYGSTSSFASSVVPPPPADDALSAHQMTESISALSLGELGAVTTDTVANYTDTVANCTDTVANYTDTVANYTIAVPILEHCPSVASTASSIPLPAPFGWERLLDPVGGNDPFDI